MMVKLWLTLSQVAERLQIDERFIFQWLRDRRLRGFKRDDVWLILTRDLNAFLESRGNLPSIESAQDRKSESRGKIYVAAINSGERYESPRQGNSG